jgi:hypothetical protein
MVRFRVMFLLATVLEAASEPSSLLLGAADSAAAASLVEQGSLPNLAQEDVLYALEHGWWGAANAMLRQLREQDAVGSMQEVRAAATRIRDQATEVINLLRTGANAEETVVSCAFQWAQRPEFVYLNVKFSSRIDGPVTVLNVDNEEVTLTNETMSFDAVGRQKPKRFQLKLAFFKEIVPERSHWSFASVGRISFTFAKAANETWPRLLLDKKAKPKNMHHWYERQVTLDAEVKKEAEKKKKLREEADKEANTSSASSPSPPSPRKKKSKRKKGSKEEL